MIRAVAWIIGFGALLAGCGLDGPPQPPAPKEDSASAARAPGSTGPSITIGGRGYIGGVVTK
ncbi:MAG: hypothetical protein OIF40_14960 [Mangrovicoccus sp.]|nr:hypothetical protein [Mangrovicoccus sp.]